MKPKISIITVCFNHAAFLEDCMESVLSQGYPNLEYIVIDGGSTDGSVEIIKKYAERLAYWVSEADRGQTDALIKGFKRATGEIEGWINSDDMLSPGALHEVADFFSRHAEARVVTGDVALVDRADRLIRVQRQIAFHRFLWLYDRNYISQSSTFWKRDLYEEVGGLDENFNLDMDGDLFFRFSLLAKIYKVRNIWSRFRVYPEQKTLALTEQGTAEKQIIRDRYLPVESVWMRRAKRLIARGTRITLKTLTGCYFPAIGQK